FEPLSASPDQPSSLFPYTTLFRSSGYIPLYAALCALLSVSPACLIFLLKFLLQRFVQMQLSLFCLRHFQGISRLTFFILTDSLRSEEHTSELQSRFDLVCRLLLEK